MQMHAMRNKAAEEDGACLSTLGDCDEGAVGGG